MNNYDYTHEWIAVILILILAVAIAKDMSNEGAFERPSMWVKNKVDRLKIWISEILIGR